MYVSGGTQMSLFGLVERNPENNHLDICALYHIYGSPTAIKTIENSYFTMEKPTTSESKIKKHVSTQSTCWRKTH